MKPATTYASRALSGWLLVGLIVGGWWTASCGSEEAPSETAPGAPAITCELGTAPVELAALAEASGATWIDSAWGSGWLLVADTGHEGRLVLLSLEGEELVTDKLPLDEGAGDDIEGLSLNPAGDVVALTSDGALRAWTLMPDGPVLSRMAYPISDDPDWVCADDDDDCPDFEGLCLDPAPEAGGCAGFAASKRRGKLVCVRELDGGYTLDPQITVTVGEPGELSACDYEPEAPHRLLVGANDHGDSALWEVRSPRDPTQATAHLLNVTGPERQEAIAFGPDGQVLLVGDNQEPDVAAAPLALVRCQ